MASSDVVLALIGDDWLTVADAQGNRPLDKADDFVRVELTAPLKRNVPVIPVLLERARMPGPTELPPELSQLARINALEITDDRWDYDVGRLISKLGFLGLTPQPPAPPAPPTAQGEVGRRRNAMARSGQPRRLAIIIGLAVAILAGILVAGGGGDHADAPQDASAPLLIDVRTNIDDFDYSGIAHMPEFFTSRPISEVGPPPNVRLEQAGEGMADTQPHRSLDMGPPAGRGRRR